MRKGSLLQLHLVRKMFLRANEVKTCLISTSAMVVLNFYKQREGIAMESRFYQPILFEEMTIT